MVAPLIEELLRRISDEGLLDDPSVDGGTVQGRASLDAAGSAVTVTIDPELDDQDDPDLDALIDAVTRTVSMSELQWKAVVESVVAEIEDADTDADPDAAAADQTDLRDDLEAKSVVVFTDAVLLRFAAQRQFPDARILVQLDENLEVETVEVEQD